ncbi:hypothetical protein NN561_001449 [Cricetulus griseus]
MPVRGKDPWRVRLHPLKPAPRRGDLDKQRDHCALQNHQEVPRENSPWTLTQALTGREALPFLQAFFLNGGEKLASLVLSAADGCIVKALDTPIFLPTVLPLCLLCLTTVQWRS